MTLRKLAWAALVTSFSVLANPGRAETFSIDAAHSMVVFKIMHMGISPIYGRFNEVSGTFDADQQGNLNSVSISIKTASVDTQVRRRDDHLRGPDFFNAVQFPNITFQSTSVQRVSDSEFDVTGNIGLHGVTRSQAVRVVRTGMAELPNGGGFHIGGEATFAIDRSAFGMTLLPGAAGDRILIMLAFDGAHN